VKIHDSVAFVTGANRGLGSVFAQQLLAAAARRVYAAARHPERITLDDVDRVRLDVTEPNSVAAAASECTDVNLLNQRGSTYVEVSPLLTSQIPRIRADSAAHYPVN
jgi:NAD(P)-dependent dehydrogenase (short-subunit alcohol dehydrogenase family)